MTLRGPRAGRSRLPSVRVGHPYRHHLNAMNRGAHRDVSKGKCISGADRRFSTAHQALAHHDAFRRDDVATLTICIAEQRNVCTTIGIVFNPLHLGCDTVFVTTEIDNPVMLLMAATAMTIGDMAVVITAGSLALCLDQGLMRTALI